MAIQNFPFGEHLWKVPIMAREAVVREATLHNIHSWREIGKDGQKLIKMGLDGSLTLTIWNVSVECPQNLQYLSLTRINGEQYKKL